MRCSVLVALTVLQSCVPRVPAVAPPDPMAEVTHGSAAKGGLFLQGFDVSWTITPHRLRHLEFGVYGAAAEGGLDGYLVAEVRGGTWASGAVRTDTPKLTVRYGAIASPEVAFVPGSTELVLNGALGRKGAPDLPAEAVVEVAVALPEGSPTDAIALWLTGFELSTLPSHPNGYTPHSLAVRAGEPRLDDDVVRFPVYARFEAAPVLDRQQALAEYGSIVRVDYALVTARGGAARRFAVQSNIDHGIDPANLTRRVEPARLPVTVRVPTGYATAVAGLSGFEVDLLVDGPVSGRYMRALTVGVEDGRYDGGRGSYDAVVALRFANAGKLPRPVKLEAFAEFTLLQLREPAEVREGRWDPPTVGQAHAVSYPELTPIEDRHPEASAAKD